MKCNKFFIEIISSCLIMSFILSGCSNKDQLDSMKEDLREEESNYFAEANNYTIDSDISIIGSEISGYIDLSTGAWEEAECQYTDPAIKEAIKANSKISSASITIVTYETDLIKEDLSNDSANYMYMNGAENVQTTELSFGGDTNAIQLAGYYPNTSKYMIIWYFTLDDKYVRSVVADFAEQEYYVYSLCEGYYLNESLKSPLTPSNEDLTDIEVSFEYSNGDISSPASLNEWVKAKAFCIADGKYHTVYYRITNIVKGETVASVIDEYNAAGHYNTINPIEDNGIEYCYCDYEVYYPEDFPERNYGLTNNLLTFSICNEEGSGMFDGYFGLTQTWDIGTRPAEIRSGETYTGRFIFAIIKNYNDFYIKYSSYEDQSNHDSYIDPT